MWQRLATLRDLHEVGLPPPAIASKNVAEKERALTRGSSLFAARVRKRYAPPLVLVITDVVHTLTAGDATVEGTATGSAADVRVEVVAGGDVADGTVTVKVSRNDGVTWGATQTLPSNGVITVDGATVTISGAPVAGEALTYTAGPDPGIRWAVAALAAHSLYYNRGSDPKASEPYKDARDQALAFAKELAKGEEAELDQSQDSTPERAEGGPLFTTRTRDGFLRGED
ncbi:MAG: hypothetical protein U0441_14880 [Polyangiaceae bacterium]